MLPDVDAACTSASVVLQVTWHGYEPTSCGIPFCLLLLFWLKGQSAVLAVNAVSVLSAFLKEALIATRRSGAQDIEAGEVHETLR
eukprot:Skav217137  [mRNA]  locus=scaffold1539:125803:127900:- [translate_table: standard]